MPTTFIDRFIDSQRCLKTMTYKLYGKRCEASRRPRHAPRPLPTPLRALSRPPALRTRQAPAPPLRGPPLELRLRRPERNDEEPDRRGDQEDRSKSARRLRESDQG